MVRLVYKGREIGKVCGKARKFGMRYPSGHTEIYIPLSLISNEEKQGSVVTDLELSFDVPDWYYEKNKEKLKNNLL